GGGGARWSRRREPARVPAEFQVHPKLSTLRSGAFLHEPVSRHASARQSSPHPPTAAREGSRGAEPRMKPVAAARTGALVAAVWLIASGARSPGGAVAQISRVAMRAGAERRRVRH